MLPTYSNSALDRMPRELMSQINCNEESEERRRELEIDDDTLMKRHHADIVSQAHFHKQERICQ